MMATTFEDLDEIFTYHDTVDEEVIEAYEAIREAAKQLAAVILAKCPNCEDREVAVRKVREAVMTANAAIALMGRV